MFEFGGPEDAQTIAEILGRLEPHNLRRRWVDRRILRTAPS